MCRNLSREEKGRGGRESKRSKSMYLADSHAMVDEEDQEEEGGGRGSVS